MAKLITETGTIFKDYRYVLGAGASLPVPIYGRFISMLSNTLVNDDILVRINDGPETNFPAGIGIDLGENVTFARLLFRNGGPAAMGFEFVVSSQRLVNTRAYLGLSQVTVVGATVTQVFSQPGIVGNAPTTVAILIPTSIPHVGPWPVTSIITSTRPGRTNKAVRNRYINRGTNNVWYAPWFMTTSLDPTFRRGSIIVPDSEILMDYVGDIEFTAIGTENTRLFIEYQEYA